MDSPGLGVWRIYAVQQYYSVGRGIEIDSRIFMEPALFGGIVEHVFNQQMRVLKRSQTTADR